MTDRVLIDTGVLVAVFAQDDEHHARCAALFKKVRPPAFTCWPVLTEVVHLLHSRGVSHAVAPLFALINAGAIIILDPPPGAAASVAKFMDTYGDRTVDVADAMLVCLAEHYRFTTVLTLDRKDFAVYRTTKGKRLRVLPE